MKKRKDTHRTARSKDLRHQKIVAESIAGKKGVEIAEEMGLSPGTVSRVLNSAETKAIIELGQQRVLLMVTDFLETLAWSQANRGEFGVTSSAIKVALEGLKSVGIIQNQIDMKHSFPESCVVELPGGGKIVMGAKGDEE